MEELTKFGECEICGRNTNLGHTIFSYLKSKRDKWLCIPCIATVRDMKNSGIDCDICPFDKREMRK